jgi:hypothetical protein
VVDEATRDRPGSPNVSLTIQEKIRVADLFVCDITTINPGAPDNQRRVPNPNVMFELGYAVAQLGWERIVLVFNRAHGAFPDDVPFDIKGHRVSDYEFSLPLEPKRKRRSDRWQAR